MWDWAGNQGEIEFLQAKRKIRECTFSGSFLGNDRADNNFENMSLKMI